MRFPRKTLSVGFVVSGVLPFQVLPCICRITKGRNLARGCVAASGEDSMSA